VNISKEIIKKNKVNIEDIDFLIPHQANKRIINSVSKNININKKKVIITIDKYGNTTNGTIPISLWNDESKFKKGNKIILSVFGAGFSSGSIYLK